VTAAALLLTVAGLLIAAGAVGVACAVRGVTVLPQRSARRSTTQLRITPLHGAAVVAGAAMLLLTGWPVAAIAAAAGVVFVPTVLGGGKASQRLIVKSQGLADWTRRLADLISSGSAGSARDALERSLSSAPQPIAGEVARLVHRIGPVGVEPALYRFAAEVADPAAEKIAGVLILRDRNGGPGLAQVLTDLAQDLDERARMLREVEAERAKPRVNVRFIVILTVVLMVGTMLFIRPFLSPYSSVVGQLLLAGVFAIFAAAFRRMRRLGDPPPNPTVLVDPAGDRSGVARAAGARP
jgi:tight adherence protein B